MYRLLKNPVFRIVLLSSSVLFLLGFGILGWGRSAPLGSQFDMRFLYIAGKLWLGGTNAYDPSLALQVVTGLPASDRVYDFAYPPQISLLAMFLGSFPWEQAKIIFTLLNLICLSLIIYFSINFIQASKKDLGLRWYVPTLIIGAPFTSEVIWMGQTSLIAGAALIGGWYFYRRKRWVISGVFLGIATIKPQLCVLIFLWFALEGCWGILGVAVATSIALCIVPLAIDNPIGLTNHWLSALKLYKSQSFNRLGWYGQTRLQNFIYLLTGFALPNLLFLGCILTLFLWKSRKQILSEDIFGILLIFSLILGFGNYYDLVLLYILIPLFWRHFSHSHTYIDRQKILGVGLLIWVVLANFVPRFISIPRWSLLLLRCDIVLLLLSAFWLLFLSRKRYQKQIISS